ncbi:MAG: hypothetical protein Q9202_002767 [Teloschistes flavicans]
MALKPWILTTPASRGIGLQLARRLLNTTDLPVVATARKNIDETKAQILKDLDVDSTRLSVFELDVTGLSLHQFKPRQKQHPLIVTPDESTITNTVSHITSLFPSQSHYLHLAFLVPGILPSPERSPAQISYASTLDTFKVNTLGPLLLMKHFSPFLPRKPTTALAPLSTATAQVLPVQHAVMATMSARVGSITDNALGGWYSYRASKAAVNQAVKTFDIHLTRTAGGKAMAVGLHPGTVKTGLSEAFWGTVKAEKLFEPAFAAERLCAVVKGLGVEEGRGRCWDWEGKEVPP